MGFLGRLFKRDAKWVIEHKGAKGRLLGASWEVCLEDDRIFRAYSHIWPKSNEWVMQNGTLANAAEKALLNEVVQAYRTELHTRSVWDDDV